MALAATPKVRRDGTIKLIDGAGSPVTLTVAYEDGNFTADLLGADADRIVIRDRGTIVGLRQGDDQVGSISFSVHGVREQRRKRLSLGFHQWNTSRFRPHKHGRRWL